jgi:hypothetical protein
MYEAKAANKNCVRFAADLAPKDAVQQLVESVEVELVSTDN